MHKTLERFEWVVIFEVKVRDLVPRKGGELIKVSEQNPDLLVVHLASDVLLSFNVSALNLSYGYLLVLLEVFDEGRVDFCQGQDGWDCTSNYNNKQLICTVKCAVSALLNTDRPGHLT